MGIGTRRALLLLPLFASCIVSVGGQSTKQQPDNDEVYPALNGVKVATLVQAVPAVAPDDPQLKGSKHVCALLVVVGADGIPKRIAVANKVTSPFDNAAITAVRQSQFRPGKFNGKPVPTRLMVWVPFLGDGHAAVPVSGSGSGKKSSGLKTLTNPVPTFIPEAELSDEARRAHVGGVVVFQVLVDEDGLPRYTSLLVPVGRGLDEKASAAVSKSKFKPATLEGEPVPFLIIVELTIRPS
jgi:hypothetical protein